MLEVVASHSQLYIMEYLIPQGADVNSRKNGETMLLTAAYQGQPQVLSLLLVNGVELSCKRFGGASALHEA